MVAALDLGSSVVRRGGSSPFIRTEVTVLEFFIEHLSDDENYPIGSIKKFTTLLWWNWQTRRT
jgi:hypothetical protein